MLCIGIAIGWSIKPATPAGKPDIAENVVKTPPVTKPAGTPPSSAESAPPPGKHALRDPKAKKSSDMPSEADMDRAKKMQGEMSKMMTGRMRSKFDLQINKLAETLNLTADQKAKMSAWLDEKMKGVEQMDFNNPESMTGMTDALKGLSTKALEDQLASTLTPDQQAAFSDYKEKDHQSKVDAAALKSLSKLQGIVQFEDGQRDEVYKVLTAAAEQKILQQDETPDPTSLFTEGMGIEMDPYDLGIQQAMTDSMPELMKNGASGDQKQAVQSLRDIIQKRIDAKVEQLRPVLNARQLEQYRAELQSKGAGVFGTVLNGMGADGAVPNVTPDQIEWKGK